MTKRVFSLMALVLLVLSVSVQAVQPRAVTAQPVLSFSGTTASCYVNCKGSSTDDELSVTLILYQGGSYVDSWRDSGTGMLFVSGQSAVESGKTYQLVLHYSVNGQAQDSVTVTKKCP